MIIAHGVDAKLAIWDIETYKEVFDFGVYDPDKKEWIEFEISAYKNDLYKIIKFYQNKEYDYYVSFNGVKFDHQVLQFIVYNYEGWYDLTGLEICKKIHDFVQRLIDDQSYDIPPPYREDNFPVKAIDVFLIFHFDNEARRTSLKWCENMLNIDIEEMPIDHNTVGLSEKDIELIRFYRRNDVIATYCVLLVCIGELDKVPDIIQEHFGYKVELPELKDYRGKNKVQDRFDVQKETGMKCLNWSDVKIGEEWNKTDYMSAENIKDTSQLFPKKVKHPYGQRFKNFFPKTMEFKTDKLKNFINEVGESYVLSKKQEFKITIGKTTYTVAKGGLHSTEKNRFVIPLPGMRYDDLDVGGQYPNSIWKLRVFPPHLKETILGQFYGKIERRTKYKKIAKELIDKGEAVEARPYSSIQEMLKLCNNGGYYGKLGQPGSFLEYPEGLLRVCMGNQIEILMLVEAYELEGFQVLSGNTDGITVLYNENQRERFLEIAKWWELKVGNIEMGKLEETPFVSVWQESINHYIGLKRDGKVKKKGRFATEFEFNKSKNSRIVPLAIEAYFIHKKDPIEFVMNHKNIFDFCICKKGTRKLRYEELLPQDAVNVYHKIVRYYISNSGNILKKRGIDINNEPVDSYCEAMNKDYPWLGLPKVQVFNRPFSVDNIKKHDINYTFYIIEILERIDAIEKTKKAKYYADRFKAQQTSLF